MIEQDIARIAAALEAIVEHLSQRQPAQAPEPAPEPAPMTIEERRVALRERLQRYSLRGATNRAAAVEAVRSLGARTIDGLPPERLDTLEVRICELENSCE